MCIVTVISIVLTKYNVYHIYGHDLHSGEHMTIQCLYYIKVNYEHGLHIAQMIVT